MENNKTKQNNESHIPTGLYTVSPLDTDNEHSAIKDSVKSFNKEDGWVLFNPVFLKCVSSSIPLSRPLPPSHTHIYLNACLWRTYSSPGIVLGAEDTVVKKPDFVLADYIIKRKQTVSKSNRVYYVSEKVKCNGKNILKTIARGKGYYFTDSDQGWDDTWGKGEMCCFDPSLGDRWKSQGNMTTNTPLEMDPPPEPTP